MRLASMRRRAGGAASALLAAGLASCCFSAHGPDAVVRVASLAAAPAAAPPLLRAVHFGDFGDRTCQRGAVASAIVEASRRAPFDLALAAGDNIYECGPDPGLEGARSCAFEPDGASIAPGYQPPADRSFFAALEGALEGLRGAGGPAPIYLVLGNHDVHTGPGCGDASAARLKACLEVAHRSPSWIMPGRHYLLDRGPARFIAIDSNLLKGDYGGFTIEGEAAFVAGAAAGCASAQCFVLAHHNPASAGEHVADMTADYLARLGRLEQAAGGRIAAWLGGHDHDLQHLRSAAGYDVLVSGNTARGRPQERFATVAPSGARLLFASTSWGYGILEVSAQGWSYRFENERGEPLHCCAAAGSGPCQPVACR